MTIHGRKREWRRTSCNETTDDNKEISHITTTVCHSPPACSSSTTAPLKPPGLAINNIAISIDEVIDNNKFQFGNCMDSIKREDNIAVVGQSDHLQLPGTANNTVDPIKRRCSTSSNNSSK